MIGIIPFIIEVSKLAICGILLWYVLSFLAIPDIPKKVCQVLIVLILIMVALSMVVNATPLPSSNYGGLGLPHSIITPERR